MNSILTCILFLTTIPISGQPICKPTITIKVKLCHSRIGSDSTCVKCSDCYPRLVPEREDFIIESFVLTAGGENFDGDIYEARNMGPEMKSWTVLNIIRRIGKGSYIEFGCIKARSKDGRVYILQPLFIEF